MHATATTTHQDHVVAHVIGATVLGHFVLDETLHLLLDMGFIWIIYLDLQMSLLPQAVAIGELETDVETRARIEAEVELLARESRETTGLQLVTPAPIDCLISAVEFYERDDRRRMAVAGDEGSLIVETSLALREIVVTVGAE
jgi:hypothetical protein